MAKRFVQTPEHTAAVTDWIKQLGCPDVAHDSVRAKFKRLRLTPVQIQADMHSKLSLKGTQR